MERFVIDIWNNQQTEQFHSADEKQRARSPSPLWFHPNIISTHGPRSQRSRLQASNELAIRPHPLHRVTPTRSPDPGLEQQVRLGSQTKQARIKLVQAARCLFSELTTSVPGLKQEP